MTITEIIKKDLPHFNGICIREGKADIYRIKEFGISLAWTLNTNRAKNYSKVLIAGNYESKGKYFIADIKEIISISNVVKKGNWKDALVYHQEIFGEWIDERIEGNVNDNDALNERVAVIFENPSEVRYFTEDFSFLRSSFYYINTTSNIIGEYLEIENFGKVKDAKIRINGLSVIAGINDTGKSTVGKIMFSIVKAISRYEQDFNENKEQIVFETIEKLYFQIRRLADISNDLIRDEFFPRKFFNQTQIFLNANQHSLFSNDEEISTTQIENFFKFKFSVLEKIIDDEVYLKRLLSILNEIKTHIIKKENRVDRIERALKKVFHSEFFSEINPKGTSKRASITYSAGGNKILGLNIVKNEIESLIINEDLSFKDVIFIETPLLLQLYGLIQTSDVIFDTDNLDNNYTKSRSKVSLHTKDLISKIDSAKYYSNKIDKADSKTSDLLNNISTVIGGGFSFDKDGTELVFVNNKNDKNYNIKPTNTASGIKSFGIIQLLLQADILNDKSLLIIDEPENHLHPQWQIEYAKMIIELVKNDISIIITSHSPYIIQALKYYSEENNVEDKTNYYFAEKDGSYSIFSDVTDDLNKIFIKLAEPLRDLVWTK